MAVSSTSSNFSDNSLLKNLPACAFAQLKPRLELVSLTRRAPLEAPQKPIKHLYFIEHGIASVVIATGQDAPVEVALVGWEGVTGVPRRQSLVRGVRDARV